ncbi:hypothetical protein ONZ43_g1133 [Nemania bipapillata]|uniref:Uncharacterized protein n=1 Tax=Nemania bipapillata TaxID=110536 RepID=A0ACC2J5Y0_9PEZI|nr:hypothetical protein ONZ43_g1133 [Nemania bipapillata]
MDYNAAAIRFGRIARHLIVRDDDSKCHPQPDIDLCEKPASSDKTTPITIGVIVGIVVVGTLAVLTFLHLRRKRKDKEEWPKSNQELEDYGFAVPSSSVRQPQNTHQQPPQQQHDQYQHQDTRQAAHHDSGLASQNPPRYSLDDLERSLRGGQTTGAFRRQEEQISADMKPVQPSDRI